MDWSSFNDAPLGVHIAYYIIVAVFFTLLFGSCILCLVYAKKLKTKRRLFLETLNDEQVALISRYTSIDISFYELFTK